MLLDCKKPKLHKLDNLGEKVFNYRRLFIRRALGGANNNLDEPNTVRIKLPKGGYNFYFDIVITKYYNYGNYYGIYKTLCATHMTEHTRFLNHTDLVTSVNKMTQIEVFTDGEYNYLDITHLGTASDCTITIDSYGFGIMDVQYLTHQVVTKSGHIGQYYYIF